MQQIKIILADDHELIREGTRRTLEQFPGLEVVGEASDGERALELGKTLQPDVAVLDIRMPKLNGVDVVRLLKEVAPETKALMLSAYEDDDYVLAVMEVGAAGYLLKTTGAKELAGAIQRVHDGETVLDPAIAAKVARLWSRYRNMDRNNAADRCQELSAREREVLELSARGLRNKAIADTLGISPRTVEGHFNSIFAKLHVGSRLEAVLYAVSKNAVDLTEKSAS